MNLKKWVFQEKKAMFLLPDEDRLFLETIVRPRYPKIRELYIRHHPNGWWEELIGEPESPEDGKGGTEIADTLRHALEFYDFTVDEDDDRRITMFDFSGAHDVVDSPYFTPDQWLSNSKLLDPVIQCKNDALIPKDVRRRLEATYASFIFGNWFACIAMARSALEYALRSRALTLGIDVKSSEPSEMDLGLYELIHMVVNMGYSDLFESMERIRRRGNAVMHPTNKRKLSDPGIKESQAIVRDLKFCIERLFRASKD